MKTNLSKADREDRKALFGRLSDGFQTNQPYNWKSEGQQLLEIPVTTFPIFKVPIHISYLLYLGRYSTHLAKLYFWKALLTCKLLGVGPSLLLHPLDFLGEEDDKDLAFFPAMDQPAQKKIKLVEECLEMMTSRFDVVTMKEHADRVRDQTRRHRAIDSAPEGVGDRVLV